MIRNILRVEKMSEDLANWKPQSNTVYKGYSRRSRRGHYFGKVIIHIRGNQYVGGFLIVGGKANIWYNEGYARKEIIVPTDSCSFTKIREGNSNIYNVVINVVDTSSITDDKKVMSGNGMDTNNRDSGKVKITLVKEDINWLDRLLKRTDPAFWKKTIQSELDTRWRTFDDSTEKLKSDFEKFNRGAMEITEEENNLEAAKREWVESLTSLGNLLNKNTTHEKQMWETTQRNKNIKGLKIKQKFKDSDVDEIRFNNMMEYIKQYPELQSKTTIERSIDAVKDKRGEVIDAEKTYNAKKKEANVYLNIAKNKLQEVDDELASFEKMKKEGEQKVNDAQFKGLKNKILNWNKTEAEKQSTRLDMFTFDRKIDVSKNQLKLIGQRLEKYEERKFIPTVTTKFKDIEE
jgi:hypothetical protein